MDFKKVIFQKYLYIYPLTVMTLHSSSYCSRNDIQLSISLLSYVPGQFLIIHTNIPIYIPVSVIAFLQRKPSCLKSMCSMTFQNCRQMTLRQQSLLYISRLTTLKLGEDLDKIGTEQSNHVRLFFGKFQIEHLTTSLKPTTAWRHSRTHDSLLQRRIPLLGDSMNVSEEKKMLAQNDQLIYGLELMKSLERTQQNMTPPSRRFSTKTLQRVSNGSRTVWCPTF